MQPSRGAAHDILRLMEHLELFQRLGLAIAIGFAVGVDRGWKQREAEDESRVAGLRTYTLIGLLGGVTALLSRDLGVAAFAAIAIVFGLAWSGYKAWETCRDGDISVTGLVAGLTVFALSAYAQQGDLQLAAAGGVVLVSVLAFKQAVHKWLRSLTWSELRSVLLILAATFVALPMLPDRAIDPYGAFNPRDLWLLTVVLAGASFIGYIALRALGSKVGLYVAAAVGAFVSSTAVTLDLARRVKAEEIAEAPAAAAASLANTIMFARVAALLAIIAPTVFTAAIPALATACVLSVVGAGALFLIAERGAIEEKLEKLRSPLDLKEVGQLALLLSAITVASRLITHFFGDAGITAFALFAGLVDVDAVTLAIGGISHEELSPSAAALAVLVAVASNTAVKTALAASSGRTKFTIFYGGVAFAALVAGVAAFYFVSRAGSLSAPAP